MRFEIDGTKLYTIKDGPRDSNRGGGNRQSEGGFGSAGGFGGLRKVVDHCRCAQPWPESESVR